MSSSTEKTSSSTAQTTNTPRKRRRRTAATGAAEDCFTCRKRQTRCDRRRPYCTFSAVFHCRKILTHLTLPGSQCLEIGKDCSGYRTTLTWGVGVASRGKLRGLSLPIANSNSSKTSNVSSDTKSQTTTKTCSSSPPKGQDRAQNVKSDDASYANNFGRPTDIPSTNFASTGISPT